MIIGKNKVQNIVVSSIGSVEPLEGYPIENILIADTLQKCKFGEPPSNSDTDIVIKIEFSTTDPKIVGIYGLNNDIFGAGVSFYDGALIESKVGLANNERTAQVAIYESSSFCNEIRIGFNNLSGMREIGYIWVGDAVEFDVKDFQISMNSDDDATISRGNGVQANKSFLYDTLQFSPNYEEYSSIRSKIRAILEDGYAEPRPFYLDLDCSDSNIHWLGILDSGTAKLDSAYLNDKLAVNTTLGMREVN